MRRAHKDPLQESDGGRFASIYVVSAQRGLREGTETIWTIFLKEGDATPAGARKHLCDFVPVFVQRRIRPKQDPQRGPCFDICNGGNPYRHVPSLPAVPDLCNTLPAFAPPDFRRWPRPARRACSAFSPSHQKNPEDTMALHQKMQRAAPGAALVCFSENRFADQAASAASSV